MSDEPHLPGMNPEPHKRAAQDGAAEGFGGTFLPLSGRPALRNAHGERQPSAGGKALFSEEELRSITGDFAGGVSEWSAFYRRFMRSDLWREIREKAITDAGWKCQFCGRGSAKLHVHHLAYIRFGGQERPADLMALCEECHAKADDQRREAMRALRYLKWWRGGYEKFMERTCGEDWRGLDYADSLESYRDCDAWFDEWRQGKEFETDEDFETDGE
jgi:hypothetical protein